ncbi:MAG: Glycosyl transferase family 2 [Candidatus Amesbacteria bacterium GW2011_GWC2_47_8]|uniref:Glycosyl transferase family 2 n=1 Tax=Candidatus Amesbacteria bacterium GW2011_GWC2_47_8 TaxID=1618367 RepID=A0A0G1TP90_9BACT|nr:MAG: Glycosyl transferase family 2 [Candidatus Amesbacteria bacterium GW2011_GWC2_47_8]
MRIVAHTIVRNESRWVYEVMVWDTGSTDNTARIIKSIGNPKISFRQIDITSDETALSHARQQMLNQTNSDWLMILDGDEVWLEESIKKIQGFINNEGQNFDSIVVPTLNCVGDIYHIMPPSAGQYHIAGHVGHYNLRFINLKRISGVHVANPPGQLQSYFDKHGTRIQDRDPNHIAFIDAPYLHMTHLRRSGSREKEMEVFWRQPKLKTELGIRLASSFSFPKCFYFPRPEIVSSPWERRNLLYTLNAAWQTPLKYIKRRIFKQAPYSP